VSVGAFHAGAEVRGRIEERVGSLVEDGSPTLEVTGGRLLTRYRDDVDVVVHDGGAGREARQRIGGDLVGQAGRVRVALLGGRPVDRGLDDHRRLRHGHFPSRMPYASIRERVAVPARHDGTARGALR